MGYSQVGNTLVNSAGCNNAADELISLSINQLSFLEGQRSAFDNMSSVYYRVTGVKGVCGFKHQFCAFLLLHTLVYVWLYNSIVTIDLSTQYVSLMMLTKY